eukprot:TRINITY_DN1674_c0_g1_i3.p2 TRINITY_DN1674_c0_g1~~TRINITY_DN1674_c0_g1_i3.p2  ORF type:complete len:227 (-),score=48.24 TRINITY_DN1674_c0_g1_i3:66-746(-)
MLGKEVGTREMQAVLFLALLLCLTSSQAAPQWIASFLNTTERARCEAFFAHNNPAGSIVWCEHHTIVYNPPSMKPYEPHFGEKQVLRIMAQARDTHDHALLVHLDQGSLHSTNLFPHITVFCGPETGIYGAVYSNVLWERFNDDTPLIITRNADGYPTSTSLSTGKPHWNGALPDFLSKQYPLPGNATYPATKGMVQVFEPSHEVSFHTIVCLDSQWDGDNCNVQK